MEASPASQGALELFFSYAHEDWRYRERLERHLSTLRNEGLLVDWHDGMIEPGAEWDDEIRARLARADIILLLVSADFLASNYIRRVELREALDRHGAGQAKVIPVIVQPCDWTSTPLGALQALPREAKPIMSWRHTEEAYLDVARGIRTAAEGIRRRRAAGSAGATVARTALKRVAVTIVELSTVGDLDVERRLRALERAADVLTRLLTGHGATVDATHPDELTAVFGMPRLADDDTLRAVHAAAELHDCLPALNDDLRELVGVTIEARTAVDAGMLLVDGAKATNTAARTAAAGARRLLREARGGETLIGDAAYRLVSHAVRAELREAADGTQVRRLVGVLPDAPVRPLRPRSPTVGRDWESTLLRTTFERAVSQRTCRLCVLVGPPGIGKSRLAQELTRNVAGKAVVLRGACVESRPAYWPLLEIIRQAAALEPTEPADRVREKIAALFEGGEDAVRDAEAIAGLIDLGEPTGDVETSARAVRRLLEVVATKTPLVVVLDDLHAAKHAFLDLLHYVAGQSYGSPLLLVCLAWPELDERRPHWGADLPNAVRIGLEPLLVEDSGRLLENLLGGEVEDGVRRRIAEAADGNPLFVEELVAMLAEHDLLETRDGVWRVTGELPSDLFPDTVDAVVAARIDALPDPERTLVSAGSVEGMRFHLGAVAELTRDSLGGDVEPALAALGRKGLVGHDRAEFPGGAACFRHIVIQEQAYESIPKGRRSELHERFAAWVESTVGERLAEYEEIVAHHLERAYELKVDVLGPHGERVRELATRAGRLLFSVGRRALARGDVAEATSLLERANALLPADDPGRAALLLDLAVAQMETGALNDALLTYDAAAASARTAGDVRIEWYARIQRSGVSADLEPDVGTKALAAEAAEAYRVFTELGDELGLAKVWHRRGFVAAVECRWRVAQEAFQRARRHARRGGADRDEAVASSMLFYCLVLGPANVTHAVRRSERILAETRFRGVAGVGLAALGNLHAMRGDFENARNLLEQSRVVLEDLGQKRRLIEASFFAASAELLAGEAATAAEHLRRAREAAAAAGQRGLLSSIDAHLAEALYALGRYEEAEDAALTSADAAAEDDLFTQMRWRPVRAKVLARNGDLEAALSLAREAVECAATTDDVNAHAAALADQAEVLRLASQEDDARRALDAAVELYRLKGNVVGEEGLRRRW